MQALRTPTQEAAEDIFFGQIVIIWARWFLIFTGIILILWTTSEASQLVRTILPILGLMVMNFFLHGRYLAEKPANQNLLLITSLLDLAIITIVVYFWEPGGLENQFFIFYYPIVLAVSFVFPRPLAVGYTVLALVAYAGASAVADVSVLTDVVNQKLLIHRLVTIAAMGGLGTFYWRIQRDRRRASNGR